MNIDTKIETDKSLGDLTTFGIGGTADFFLLANSPDEIIGGIRWAKEKGLPVIFFGGGSNSFFADGDYHSLVIRVLGGEITISGLLVTADAGTPTTLVIIKTIEAGLGGLEKMTGIPGTIGGAVVGNAGAYGMSVADVVNRVEIWDGQTRRWLSREECQFDYRESIFKHQPWVVLQVELKMKPGRKEELENTAQECRQARSSRYPKGTRGPGCFFKNIEAKNLSPAVLKHIPEDKINHGKIPTGWLIEASGMKGKKVGDIQVAEFHANFIINTGRGTAKDVLTLVNEVQTAVKEKFGIPIEPEARYLAQSTDESNTSNRRMI